MEADALHEDCINNRKRLQFCVNILLGLLKRTNNKSNLLPEVVPFINSLIPVTRYFNEMWDPNLRVFCNPIFRDKIYASATDADRSHLLEFIQQNAPSSSSSVAVSVDAFSAVSTLNFFNSSFSTKQLAIDRQLQSFLWNQHENLFSLLGTSISSLPSSIVFPQSDLFLTVLNKSQNLPRLKLRAILKHFVKPYVQNCPNDTVSLTQSLLPLSSSFIPWLFKHIDDRWEVYRCNNNSTTSIGAEGQTTSDDKNLENEVIEDQSNRLLSREFIELFQSTLISFPVTKDLSSPLKRQPLLDSILESDDTEMDDSIAASMDSNEPGISDIGRFLLHHNLQSWTTMSFGQLTWVDSAVSLKASKTCYPILKELLAQGVICSAEDVSFILHHIFLALKLFGESEQNKASLIDLLLILFEGLVKNNAGDAIKAPFWILSQTDQSQWLKFEKTFISDPAMNSSSVSSTAFKGKVSDKRKKDAIKTLVVNVIGVSLALLYVDRCFVPPSSCFAYCILSFCESQKSSGELYSLGETPVRNLKPFLRKSKSDSEADVMNRSESNGLCTLFS